jgi:hypothetical protein
MVDSLKLVATLLPLSMTAGINLYATVAMVGLSEKYHWIDGMPAGLQVFDNWGLISVAIVLYIIEFIVDKFEFFDNAWDVISTFIRPVGAFAMGSAALGSADPSVAIGGALVCSAIALQTHVSKAGTRVALNVISPAETVSNITLSTIEDAFVFLLVWCALTYPIITGVVSSILLGISIALAPRLFRWTLFFMKSFFAMFASWVHSKSSWDTPPATLMELTGHTDIDASLECKCSGISTIRGRNGYLVVSGDKVLFLYKRYLMLNKWEYLISEIPKAYMRRKFFIDIIEIPYKNEKGKSKTAHFAFLKTKRDMTEKMTDLINSRISG